MSLPAPEIHGNRLLGNTSKNLFADAFGAGNTKVIQAQGNWWGTTDALAISASIRDRKDDTDAPYVDFSGFLNAAGGTPASTETPLYGGITQNTTLPAGSYAIVATLPKGTASPFVLTQEVRSEKDWTPTLLAERQKRLVDVLDEHWNLAVADDKASGAAAN